ncbi:hypothetical protein PVAP13_3KG165627, partial [Panicum virgatum]
MHLQYHTGITVSEDAVLSTYRQETSWKKREQEFFPLVDQLKLQRREHTDPIVTGWIRMEELHIHPLIILTPHHHNPQVTQSP